MNCSEPDHVEAVKATSFILQKIKQEETKKSNAEKKLKSLKGMISSARKLCVGSKGMSTQTLMRMRQVQSLESQRSRATESQDELSDLALELWSGEFTSDYKEKANEITDKPGVRSPGTSMPRRLSSYDTVKGLLDEKTLHALTILSEEEC
jgi:hypothetical protein